jgi:hypothetical protein
MNKKERYEGMNRTVIASGLKRSLLGVAFIAFVVLFGNTCFAEMRITTHDGRMLKVPVQAKEIRIIEFTDAESAGFRYLGCFKDQGDPTGTAGRDLSGFVVNDPQMTTDKCVSLCRDKGFKFAGTQYSSWCFCGNAYGKSGKASNCNMKCSGNSNQICGGSWANSIYSVD